MVALAEKLLPLTVRRNSGSPEFTVEGATSAMLGMLPAAAGVVAFELYPQASVMAIRAVRDTVNRLFIFFLMGSGPFLKSMKAGKRRCQRQVKWLSTSCRFFQSLIE
jgi:hypothetical protein